MWIAWRSERSLYIYICTHIHVYIHIYVYIYIYIHIYIHRYIDIYVDRYICIHIYTWRSERSLTNKSAETPLGAPAWSRRSERTQMGWGFGFEFIVKGLGNFLCCPFRSLRSPQMALPTETKVGRETSQSKSGTSFNSSNRRSPARSWLRSARTAASIKKYTSERTGFRISNA